MRVSEFPEDEFDRLADERRGAGVAGAHRQHHSNKAWWIALVVILIAAPLIGWGAVQAVGNRYTTGTASTLPSATAASTAPAAEQATEQATEPATTPTTETTAAPATESPSATPSTAAVLSRPVLVLNATGINGYAAQIQGQLQNAGWTNVSIGTYKYARPSQSQIYYPAATDADTVTALGSQLGISDFRQNAQATGGDQIVVVLAH